MREVIALVKRNITKYYRNVGVMIFSILSAFIVAALYMFFLADMQIDYVRETAGNLAGIENMINTWIVGGLILIPAVSVPLVLLCFKVDDVVSLAEKDLMVTPVKRFSIILGYVLSACIVSFVMTVLCFVLCEIFIVAKGGDWLAFGDTMGILGIAILVILSFTGLEFFFISFMKSTSGVTVANSILNVLLGFLLGLYVPVGMLGDGVGNAIKSFPLLQASSVIRQIIMKDSLEEVLGNAPASVVSEVRQMYGIDIVIGDAAMHNTTIIAILIIFGIIFYIGSILVLKYRKDTQ